MSYDRAGAAPKGFVNSISATSGRTQEEISVSAEHIVSQAPMRDNVHEYIIDMLLSLANMAAETKQTALAARIRSAADSTVVFL